jgi:hypothetical protein
MISRGAGKTPTERHLAKLADKSFLNLWSYPNVFNDKRSVPNAQGQELCDLLVVCDPYVLVFSDKHVDWLGDESLSLSWKRWYKRAISHSVRQIRGAQRWIASFPERIFIDPDCNERLPVDIPPDDRRMNRAGFSGDSFVLATASRLKLHAVDSTPPRTRWVERRRWDRTSVDC